MNPLIQKYKKGEWVEQYYRVNEVYFVTTELSLIIKEDYSDRRRNGFKFD